MIDPCMIELSKQLLVADRCPDCGHVMALHSIDKICDMCDMLDGLRRDGS